ncbi:hypothetical protein BGZ81_007795 [Podila clonocystis]|nr:hypothetical protein BGZ81_007795 [Podila clonocystis]
MEPRVKSEHFQLFQGRQLFEYAFQRQIHRVPDTIEELILASKVEHSKFRELGELPVHKFVRLPEPLVLFHHLFLGHRPALSIHPWLVMTQLADMDLGFRHVQAPQLTVGIQKQRDRLRNA